MCTTPIDDIFLKSTCVLFYFSDAQATMSGGIQVDTTLFLLDDVVCKGNETSLLDCAHVGFHFHNCAPTEEAGVICGTCVSTCIMLLQGISVHYI